MPRIVASIVASAVLAALALSGCGANDDERTKAATAAFDAIRPAYEARLASLARARETARGWKGKAGLPPVALGDRPKPVLAFETLASDRTGANARLLEVDDAGAFETRLEGILWAMADLRWLRDLEEQAPGRGYATAGGVRGAYEAFQQVRYLALLVTESRRAPSVVAKSGGAFSVDFTPGRWTGKVVLYDLSTDTMLGGAELAVENSAKVDFKTFSSPEKAEREKHGQSAVERDLREAVVAAARHAVGAD